MRFLKGFFGLLAVGFAGLVSAGQAQVVADQNEIVPNTNIDTLNPLLQQEGLTPEKVTLDSREVLVLRSGGYTMILRPTVCNPQCVGLQMYALFEGSSPAGLMNEYNSQTPPTVVFGVGGNTVLSRYLIADHGMTRGSFLVNLNVFKNTLQKWTVMRNRNNAMSVALGDMDMSPDKAFEREGRDFLNRAMVRPELYSQRPRQSF